MKKKKTYVTPSMEVVKMEMQNCLLDSSIENGKAKSFEEDWE